MVDTVALLNVNEKFFSVLQGKRLIVVWCLSTLLIAIASSAFFDVPKFYRLTRFGTPTNGEITDLEPLNHQSVVYRYVVANQSHVDRGHASDIGSKFDELSPGQQVAVFYDPQRPDVSCLGTPNGQLESVLILTAIVAACPTLFLLASELRRILKGTTVPRP
jgi:hypothetical protein